MARVGPRTDGRFRRISPRSIRDVAGRRRDRRAGCDRCRIGCSRPYGGRRVGFSDGHGGGVPHRRFVRRQRFVSCRGRVSCDRHVLGVLGGGKRGAACVPSAREDRVGRFVPPPDSSSPYNGKAHWQWFPPGNRCEYRVFTFETVTTRATTCTCTQTTRPPLGSGSSGCW